MTRQEIFKVAFSWPVVRRSLTIAAIVGAILVAINHGGRLIRGDFDSLCIIRCGLTCVVPYCVSTVSCVLTYCDRCRKD